MSRVTLQVRGRIWAKTADVGRHRWQVKGQGSLVAEVYGLWGTGLGERPCLRTAYLPVCGLEDTRHSWLSDVLRQGLSFPVVKEGRLYL